MSFLLDAMTTSGIFVLVALGLWFIFGLLDVINLALAGFMAVGVYTAVAVGETWLGLLSAVIVSAAFGLLLELLVVRRLYHRPLDAIVATWGASIVLVQILSLLFTPAIQTFPGPLDGVFWFNYPAYRILLTLVAAGLLVAVGAVLHFTRAGLVVRLVMHNEPLAAGVGINTSKVRTLTFVVGSAVSGAVGALIGPIQTVTPDYGESFLIIAILAVLLSGSRVWGLIIACLVIGVTTSLFNTFAPVPAFGNVAVVIVGVIALRFFPGGFVWKRRAK